MRGKQKTSRQRERERDRERYRGSSLVFALLQRGGLCGGGAIGLERSDGNFHVLSVSV